MLPLHTQPNAPTSSPILGHSHPQTWTGGSRFPPHTPSPADLRSCTTVAHTLTSPFQFPPPELQTNLQPLRELFCSHPPLQHTATRSAGAKASAAPHTIYLPRSDPVLQHPWCFHPFSHPHPARDEAEKP